MADLYRCVKSPKGFTCGCGKHVPAKTHRIEEQRGGTTVINRCLSCGEGLLVGRRAMHKERWALCNRVLNKLRSKYKDRVIQRLS